MTEPTPRTDRAAFVLRGLLEQESMPSCFLDEAFNLVYWNAAFDRLVESHWSLSARALAGRHLLTSLPLPAPLLLALACLPSDPKPELLPRLQLGMADEAWDTRITPYMEDGALLGVLMMFQDRTADMKREQDEQPRLQLLQALLATTEEAVCWVMANGTIRL